MDRSNDRTATVSVTATPGGAMRGGAFVFDTSRPMTRVSEADVLEGLRRFTEVHAGRRLTLELFSAWPERPCCAHTLLVRLGTWRKALRRVGVEGGRIRNYQPEDMVEILEAARLHFGVRIEDEDAKGFVRVGDLVTYLQNRLGFETRRAGS